MSNKVEVIVTLKDNASSALKGITSSLSGMATVAGGIVAANVFGKITEGIFGLAQEGWNGARSVENLSGRLDAFNKDTAKTAEMLAWARSEAAKTSFSYDDIGNAIAAVIPVANQLGVDYKELVQTGELLSALNPLEGIQGGVFSLKEALQGDFISISERFGLDKHRLRELRDEGIPTLEAVQQVLTEMGVDMDLVANQANTFDGRMGRLKDTVGTLATAFATPLFNFLSEELGIFLGDLETNLPAIETQVEKAGQFFSDIFETVKKSWDGKWVDSDVIQPLHRLAGNLTGDVKKGWDTFVEAIQRVREKWDPQWIETNLTNPLKDLAAFIMTDGAAAWDSAKEAFDTLNTAVKPWNDLMEAGTRVQEVWIRFGNVMNILTGKAAELTGAHNDAMGEGVTLGSIMAGIFGGLTAILDGYADSVFWVTQKLVELTQWANNAHAAISGAVSAAGIQSASDSAAAGIQSAADSVIPPTDPKQIGGGAPSANSQGQTTTGGTGGRGQTTGGVVTTTQQRGGDTYIFNISYPMDMEEAAYHISRIQQERRSTT